MPSTYILFIQPSTRKNKRFSIGLQNEEMKKTIHFGDSKRNTYIDHGDSKRRESYRRRAEGIQNKKGENTYLDIFSPNFWSYWLLWGESQKMHKNLQYILNNKDIQLLD